MLSASVLQLPIATVLCHTLQCGASTDAVRVWHGTGWRCWATEHALLTTAAMLCLAAFTVITTTGE
jgi:hypothetical protein